MKKMIMMIFAMSFIIFFLFFSPDGSLLKAIDGAHVDCVVKGHPALASMGHLLPENMLVSGLDHIPGLVPSPTGKHDHPDNQQVSLRPWWCPNLWDGYQRGIDEIPIKIPLKVLVGSFMNDIYE